MAQGLWVEASGQHPGKCPGCWQIWLVAG